MRDQLEDFVVDELAAYRPCGQGPHLFVRFEKSDLTTPQAVASIARALQKPPQSGAFAGLKDKRGITRQWASFEHGDPAHLEDLEIPGVRILEYDFHRNKLKTGHLSGNRFEIRVRNPDGDRATATALMEQLSTTGCPNYYGEQRFGREGDNAETALAFVVGSTRPPRDRFQRRLLFSAFQSALFNRWLADRVDRGELATAVAGDLMRKEDSGGLFTSDDLSDLRTRLSDFVISATGPMFGADMRWPLHEAAARERALLDSFDVTDAMLHEHRRLGSGTRRTSRIRPDDWQVEQEPSGDLRVSFTLPAGAYATTVMRELMKNEEPAP